MSKSIDEQYDEIDLKKVVLNLWKEKILILSFSLFFLVLSYFYTVTKPLEFRTIITLKEFPNNLILKFSEVFPEKKFVNMFYRGFTENLKSFDNLENFIKQNQNINSFKQYLKKKKISSKEYFLNNPNKEKFGQTLLRGKENDKKYYFDFPQHLNGQNFLNDYVLYTYKNSELAIKDEIKSSIINKINFYEKSLSKAKELNIQYPAILERLKDRNLVVVDNPQEMIIYNGTILLSEEIKFYTKLLNDLNEFETKFNPILDSATRPFVTSNTAKKNAIFGFIFGLLISLVCIIVKNAFKNK